MNLFNKYILFFIFLLVIFNINNVFATDLDQNSDNIYYMDDIYGDNLNSGLSIDSPVKSLNVLLKSNESKVIYINEGIYSGENNTNISLDLNNNSLYLIGINKDKCIFNGENNLRIFNISSNSNVFLINLTFINGFDMIEGGSILNNGNLNLINCTFIYNHVGFKSNQTVGFSRGGAITNYGSLLIFNSIFENNTGGSFNQTFAYGGAIYNIGSLLINKSTFKKNYVLTRYGFRELNYYGDMDTKIIRKGGAIASFSENIIIINSNFFENSAGLRTNIHQFFIGGGIYFEGSNSSLINCSFVNNSASYGGAVYFDGNNINFNQCNFLDNRAYIGAGICSSDDITLINEDVYNGLSKNYYFNISIKNCLFNNNYVPIVKIDNKYFVVESEDETIFLKQYILCGASALYINAQNCYLYNSTFYNNGLGVKIENGIIVGFYVGGSISILGDDAYILNCTFKENKGFDGGAIEHYGNSLNIVNSTFIKNTAWRYGGGAIYHSMGDLFIDNCYFNSNTAPNNGGAIFSAYNYGNNEKINSYYKNSIFINNSADYGGAIFDNGNYIKYDGLIFENNTGIYGGAINNQGFFNQFYNSSFISNKALSNIANGGAIFNQGDNLDLINCTFEDNYADTYGGAIYNSGNQISILNSSFYSNVAFKGGALTIMGGEGLIKNNIFNYNIATYGGAIYNLVSNMIISFNHFSSNSANVSGGSIYNEGLDLALYDNYMENSHASILGVGYGDYIYTNAPISYLFVSFLNNGTTNLYNNKNSTIFCNVTDNLGNSISGGFVTFILQDQLTNDEFVIGTAELVEGVAHLEFSEKLKQGTYVLSGFYSLANNNVLSKKGSLLSIASSELLLFLNSNKNEFYLGDNVTITLELKDSDDNYLPNARIMVYENGEFLYSLITNDEGIVTHTFELNILGNICYNFVFGGDLTHDKFVKFLNISVIFDGIVRDTKIISNNSIIVIENGFENILLNFTIIDEEGNPLSSFKTLDYFEVTRSSQDSLFNSPDSAFNAQYILDRAKFNLGYYGFNDEGEYGWLTLTQNNGSFVYKFYGSSWGFGENFEGNGLYLYKIRFKGGFLKHYTSSLDDEIKRDEYYNPSEAYFIVNNGNSGTETSIIIVDGNKVIDEVSYPQFNISVLGRNGWLSEDIFIFESGKFLDKVSLSGNNTIFTYNQFLDVGKHTLQFIFPGKSEYMQSIYNFDLEVIENPNKNDININGTFEGNDENYKFTINLFDNNGILLENKTVELFIYLNNELIKKSRYITDVNGSFYIGLKFGAGNYTIYCNYKGDKFFNELYKTFEITINKTKVFLFGVSPLEFIGENNYLSFVLTNEKYNAINNTKIKVEFYSNGFNATYYIITNESGVAKLKINLPVGKYVVLANFEGDNWYESAVVLSNMTMLGSGSSLQVNKTIIIKENGYYIVRLVDDNNNPLKNMPLTISINGVSYNKITDNNGFARLQINLKYGEYLILTSFKGNVYYGKSTVVSSLFVVNNQYKFPSFMYAPDKDIFRANGFFKVSLKDIFDNPLSGEKITISVNGKDYELITDENGSVNLNLNLKNGIYKINSRFDGNEKYQSINKTSILRIVNENATLTYFDAPTYLLLKGKGNSFNVTLRDRFDNILSGEKVEITVNGITYNRITNSEGVAKLNIYLGLGSYDIVCNFDGVDDYYSCQSITKLIIISEGKKVNVNVPANMIIFGKGIYKVILTNDEGNPIKNKEITLRINGVNYKRSTDENGGVNINLNLKAGNYTIKIIFNGDSEYSANTVSSTIIIKSTISGNDLVKYYKNDSQFYGSVIDSNGKPLINTPISMNINGVIYIRNTDENGLFKLNIDLSPGKYILTIMDPNIAHIMSSFYIDVLPTISVYNLNMIYGENNQYIINVVDNNGLNSSFHDIIININGIFYKRSTDELGNVYLNINFNPGNYIATVCDLANGLMVSSYINILNSKPIFVVSNDLILRNDKKYFEVKLVDERGIPLIGETISIKVNGIVYNRTIGNDGFARLAINLRKGTYDIYYNYGILRGNQTFNVS